MIPFVDLAAQQERIYAGIERRIKGVLAHGQYIMGPEVAELEKNLAELVGVRHAVSCSSGTDALLMPLMAYGIGYGDVIFTTPFTFIATAEVISLLGATPVFVDIDPKTFNIDPLMLELAIKSLKEHDPDTYPIPRSVKGQRTPRGIIAVDLFGLPADYQRINPIAKAHDLFVIEDAAQSFGGMYQDRKVGALTDVTGTSFFPAKPLGCYGDGGAILTDDDNMAALLRSIRVHGQGKGKYDNVRIGLNGRLDTLQAAILLEKLEIFPEEIESRNRIAAIYSKGLEGIVQVPFVPDGYRSAWAQYSVLSDNRAGLQELLRSAGIPTGIYYPMPLHLQGAFLSLGYRPGDFPNSEDAARRIFSLPMHPYLQDKVIERIVETIRSWKR